ncbi:MAG: helix-turn-helix domain-containing protein [Armatimonadota bacterium]
MTSRTWFDTVLEERRQDVEFLAEEVAFDFVNEIRRVMQTAGISQSELAKRLGKSRAYVSRVLNYNPNMTIKSLVAIAHVLDMKWKAPHLVPSVEEHTSEELPPSQQKRMVLHTPAPAPISQRVPDEAKRRRKATA